MKPRQCELCGAKTAGNLCFECNDLHNDFEFIKDALICNSKYIEHFFLKLYSHVNAYCNKIGYSEKQDNNIRALLAVPDGEISYAAISGKPVYCEEDIGEYCGFKLTVSKNGVEAKLYLIPANIYKGSNEERSGNLSDILNYLYSNKQLSRTAIPHFNDELSCMEKIITDPVYRKK